MIDYFIHCLAVVHSVVAMSNSMMLWLFMVINSKLCVVDLVIIGY